MTPETNNPIKDLFFLVMFLLVLPIYVAIDYAAGGVIQ